MRPLAARLRAFQRRHGLVPDGVFGPATMGVVEQLEGGDVTAEVPLPPAAQRVADAPWLVPAAREIGVHEAPGDANNPRVLEYLRTCSQTAGGNLAEWGTTRDSTPWCSAFVNWCLLEAGIEGTRSAAARSWERWGAKVGPIRGAIAVLSRGPNPARGHVAFFVRESPGAVWLLGGNQRDEVCVRSYHPSRVITYRWPDPLPR